MSNELAKEMKRFYMRTALENRRRLLEDLGLIGKRVRAASATVTTPLQLRKKVDGLRKTA